MTIHMIIFKNYMFYTLVYRYCSDECWQVTILWVFIFVVYILGHFVNYIKKKNISDVKLEKLTINQQFAFIQAVITVLYNSILLITNNLENL